MHKRRVERAEPGARVAVNLVGADNEELRRGMVLAAPGLLQPSYLLDARVRLLADLSRPLHHNEPIELFWGTARILGRARLLEAEELQPGAEGWVQLRLTQPASLLRGDRFILRQPALGLTLGGGTVVDPHPRYHPRRRAPVIDSLEAMLRGDPADLLKEALRRQEPCPVGAVIASSGLTPELAQQTLQRLVEKGQVLFLGANGSLASPPTHGATTQGRGRAAADDSGPSGVAEGTVAVTAEGWQRLVQQINEVLARYHRDFPLRSGMPREELRNRLHLAPSVFKEVVATAASQGYIACAGAVVRLAGHEVRFTPEQEARLNRLLEAYRRSPYAPPSRAEAEAIAGADIFEALVEQRRLVKVSEEFYYLEETYRQMVERLVAFLKEHERISVGQVRDLFGISRKYILPFLQHLDDIRVTRRVGDDRVLY